VKDLDGGECEGYWWLAFNWKNYRICGHLINVRKLDVFPIIEGARANPNDPISLQLEAPLLIDPLTDQARFISYERDDDVCLAIPAAGIDEVDEHRAEKTIEVLGLNLRSRLNQKRADYWDRCMMSITEYRDVKGPQVLRLVIQASALKKLKEMVVYSAEFSSVSEACIRKNAPDPLVASVFEHLPAASSSTKNTK
jgi:hypothetical protein